VILFDTHCTRAIPAKGQTDLEGVFVSDRVYSPRSPLALYISYISLRQCFSTSFSRGDQTQPTALLVLAGFCKILKRGQRKLCGETTRKADLLTDNTPSVTLNIDGTSDSTERLVRGILVDLLAVDQVVVARMSPQDAV
jgi:hypothetical protein